MSPQNSYLEALTPNVTVFGERTNKEVIKLKSKGWSPDAVRLVS